MEEIFDVYKTNFEAFSSKLEIEFKEASGVKDTENLEICLKSLDHLINEAKKVIKNMDIQENTTFINQSKSPQNSNRNFINQSKKKMENFVKNHKKLKEKLEMQKTMEKFKVEGDSSNIKEGENSENMEKLAYDSFSKLQMATRSSYEMEGITNDVLKEMDNQSQQMKDIKFKIGDIGEEADASSGLLNQMNFRAKKNKVIIFAFGTVLLLLFLIILSIRIYYKFFVGIEINNEDNKIKIQKNNTIDEINEILKDEEYQ